MGSVNLTNIVFPGKPLMSFEPIKDALDDLLVEKVGYVPTMQQLSDLFNIDFTLVTYNLTDEKREYISCNTHPDISVTSAVRMSSSYPLLFEPYEQNGKLYLDGGIVDNFSIETASLETVDGKVLGVVTLNPHKKYTNDTNNIDFAIKLLQIFVQTVTLDKISRVANGDIVILDTHSMFFNFDSSNNDIIKMFDKGYGLCRSSRTLHSGY
jgi:predicted acylesterase/phospholipase RssA